MANKRNRIRILHIITNLPVGGAQDNTLLTVERLDRTTYEVSLLCAPEGDWLARVQAIPDLELIFIKQLIRRIHPWQDLVAFVKILRIIRRGRYDIVHTHSSKPGFLGRIAAKLVRVPVIIHTLHGFSFHNFMNPVIRRVFILIERFLSRLTDKIVTVSRLNLEKALALRLGRPDQFVNIYSGIDFSRFDRSVDVEAKKQELGILNGEKIVGMVGRLSTQKSPTDLIRAIPRVLQRTRDVRFVLVGDGELRKKSERLCRELGVESRVMFLGFRDDIPELLHTFDVYVLPSLWEGLGRSLTEAMYTGRPVVATRVEGVPELVEHQKTGLLVEPQDVDALADSIVTLLADEKEARRLGQQAKARIDEAFHADRMVRELQQLYETTLAQKQHTDPT
ncbi:MAG: glycosyltransferase family 1 protein [Calditrichaeota bacterium]|nr:MAG: glycosyltransferase family 1 protein [Calditrichota bacterium]